jgi:hypothetical protein
MYNRDYYRKYGREKKDNLPNQHFISFDNFKQTYPLFPSKIHATEYFLKKYRLSRKNKHPHLTTNQWRHAAENILCFYTDKETGEKIDFVFSEEAESAIDLYFKTEFDEGCDYSILHFNDCGIKLRFFNEETERLDKGGAY